MHQTPAHMGRYSMDNMPPGKVIQQRRGEHLNHKGDASELGEGHLRNH